MHSTEIVYRMARKAYDSLECNISLRSVGTRALFVILSTMRSLAAGDR
jgi:hypothetical protein